MDWLAAKRKVTGARKHAKKLKREGQINLLVNVLFGQICFSRDKPAKFVVKRVLLSL